MLESRAAKEVQTLAENKQLNSYLHYRFLVNVEIGGWGACEVYDVHAVLYRRSESQTNRKPSHKPSRTPSHKSSD